MSTPVLVILDLDSVEEPAELLARFRADARWARVPVVATPAELLARFRADARWARVPVVATGSDAELLGDLGADGVLPKPFDAERLVSLGRESIARPR